LYVPECLHVCPFGTLLCVQGQRVYLSSLWRYSAAQSQINFWNTYQKPIGTAEMVRLLQLTSHATTEHAVVTRPGELSFDIALADMGRTGWHAPYLSWRTFAFADVFDSAPAE